MRRVFIALFIAMVVLSYVSFIRAEPSGKRRDTRFALKEKLWAVEWINEKLALLMEDGLIKSIKCSEDDSSYEVLVSSSWRLLSSEGKRDFLRNLSRAREITQHSPYLVVKDSETGEMLAQVNQWGIFVFGE